MLVFYLSAMQLPTCESLSLFFYTRKGSNRTTKNQKDLDSNPCQSQLSNFVLLLWPKAGNLSYVKMNHSVQVATSQPKNLELVKLDSVTGCVSQPLKQKIEEIILF